MISPTNRKTWVSDGAVAASKVDPNLKNPWGIAPAPGGAFWFSDNATGLSMLYDGLGDVIPLVVTIPPPKGSPSTVTADVPESSGIRPHKVS
jgi:hypothetical protein